MSIGNLESFADYGSYEVGFAVGNDLTLTPATGFQGMTADRTDGIRLFNVGLEMYEGADQRIDFDPTATGTDDLMWMGPSSSDKRFKMQADGTVWLSTLAISEDSSAQFFNAADGLLLLGPGCEITPTSWTSLRGQTATISGAFHQSAGRWPGTRGLVVEEGTENLATNPSFEINTTGWGTCGTNTIATSTDHALFGSQSCKCTYQNNSTLLYDSVTVPASGDYTLTANIWIPSGWDGGNIQISLALFTGVTTSANVNSGGVTGRWVRLRRTINIAAGDLSGQFLVQAISSPSVGKWIYVDGVQWEKLDHATSYCDGSLGAGYSWSGTPHASTSTRIATEINLDDAAGIFSGNDTWSVSMWVQMPYDSDFADWPQAANNLLWSVYEDSNNYLFVQFNPSGNDFGFGLFSDGTGFLMVADVTFSAGDWVHIVVSADFSSDEYKIYVDGELGNTDTTSLSVISTLSQMNLGAYYNNSLQSNVTVGEFAVFDRVLTASEVAAINQRNGPLSDAGAMDTPGIYITDGRFSMMSSTDGSRLEMDTAGLRMYSEESGNPQSVAVDSDGDVFFGSDVSAAATTALAIFANNQTYNSESVSAGDIMFGDNSSGKINLYWDKSVGELIFRRGTADRISIDSTNGFLNFEYNGTGTSHDTIFWKVGGTTKAHVGLDGATGKYRLEVTGGYSQSTQMYIEPGSVGVSGDEIHFDVGGNLDLITITYSSIALNVTTTIDGQFSVIGGPSGDGIGITMWGKGSSTFVADFSGSITVDDDAIFGGAGAFGQGNLASAQLLVNQDATDGAIPVLMLDQGDLDQAFIQFKNGTTYTGKTGADEYMKVVNPSGSIRYVKLYS